VDAVRVIAFQDSTDHGWVTRVDDFSSQFQSDNFAAQQVLGAPDVYPEHGISPKAWTPSSMNSPSEWLTLELPRAVAITSIDIYETNAPGYCVGVSLEMPNGEWDTVWSGSPQLDESSTSRSRIFSPALKPTWYKTRRIRLDVDTSGLYDFYQIDAVRALGRSSLWSTHVIQSSCQGGPNSTFCNASHNQLVGVPNAWTAYKSVARSNDEATACSYRGATEPQAGCSSQEDSVASSWMPSLMGRGEEWLELTFDLAIKVASVAVYETRALGALKGVKFMPNNSSQWDTVWEGCAGQLNGTVSRVYAPRLLARGYETKRIRLEFSTAGFSSCYAIDGVEVIAGVEPELPVFMCAACPSAHYKDLTGDSQCRELGPSGSGDCKRQYLSNISSHFKCPDTVAADTAAAAETKRRINVTCPAGSYPAPQTCKAKVSCRGSCCGLEAPLSSSRVRLALLSSQIVGVRPGNKISRWSTFYEGNAVYQPSLAVENGIQHVRFEASNTQILHGGPVALNFQSAGQRQRLRLTCLVL
jgi:hypothetical protein